MAKRQQSQSTEASGTRGRVNMTKTSSKGSNNRRSPARVADNPEEQMQSAIPSDGMGQRNGRSRSGRGTSRAKKGASKAKTTSPSRTRAAR